MKEGLTRERNRDYSSSNSDQKNDITNSDQNNNNNKNNDTQQQENATPSRRRDRKSRNNAEQSNTTNTRPVEESKKPTTTTLQQPQKQEKQPTPTKPTQSINPGNQSRADRRNANTNATKAVAATELAKAQDKTLTNNALVAKPSQNANDAVNKLDNVKEKLTKMATMGKKDEQPNPFAAGNNNNNNNNNNTKQQKQPQQQNQQTPQNTNKRNRRSKANKMDDNEDDNTNDYNHTTYSLVMDFDDLDDEEDENIAVFAKDTTVAQILTDNDSDSDKENDDNATMEDHNCAAVARDDAARAKLKSKKDKKLAKKLSKQEKKGKNVMNDDDTDGYTDTDVSSDDEWNPDNDDSDDDDYDEKNESDNDDIINLNTDTKSTLRQMIDSNRVSGRLQQKLEQWIPDTQNGDDAEESEALYRRRSPFMLRRLYWGNVVKENPNVYIPPTTLEMKLGTPQPHPYSLQELYDIFTGYSLKRQKREIKRQLVELSMKRAKGGILLLKEASEEKLALLIKKASYRAERYNLLNYADRTLTVLKPGEKFRRTARPEQLPGIRVSRKGMVSKRVSFGTSALRHLHNNHAEIMSILRGRPEPDWNRIRDENIRQRFALGKDVFEADLLRIGLIKINNVTRDALAKGKVAMLGSHAHKVPIASRKVIHSTTPFQRDFYEQHPELTEMSQEEADEWLEKNQISLWDRHQRKFIIEMELSKAKFTEYVSQLKRQLLRSVHAKVQMFETRKPKKVINKVENGPNNNSDSDNEDDKPVNPIKLLRKKINLPCLLFSKADQPLSSAFALKQLSVLGQLEEECKLMDLNIDYIPPQLQHTFEKLTLLDVPDNLHRLRIPAPAPLSAKDIVDENGVLRKPFGIKMAPIFNQMRACQSMDQVQFPDYISKIFALHKFTKPTPVQSQSWPMILSGHDTIAIAPTGSGKTLAYLLPGIIHLNAQPRTIVGQGPVVLIIAPSRELSIQIHQECVKLTQGTDVVLQLLLGKHFTLKDLAQVVSTKRMDIMISTTGILFDLLENFPQFSLKRVSYLVFDEADALFSPHIMSHLVQIVRHIRPDRQTVLFSATWNLFSEIIQYKLLNNNPYFLRVGRSHFATNSSVKQSTFICDSIDAEFAQGLRFLVDFTHRSNERIMVFCPTAGSCESMTIQLRRLGVAAGFMHGKVSGDVRGATLSDFRVNLFRVLCVTDAISRGLDIKGLRHLVNIGLPPDMHSFTHRVGRVGRAGEEGWCYNLVSSSRSQAVLRQLTYLLHNSGQPIPSQLRDQFISKETGGLHTEKLTGKDLFARRQAEAIEIASKIAEFLQEKLDLDSLDMKSWISNTVDDVDPLTGAKLTKREIIQAGKAQKRQTRLALKKSINFHELFNVKFAHLSLPQRYSIITFEAIMSENDSVAVLTKFKASPDLITLVKSLTSHLVPLDEIELDPHRRDKKQNNQEKAKAEEEAKKLKESKKKNKYKPFSSDKHKNKKSEDGGDVQQGSGDNNKTQENTKRKALTFKEHQEFLQRQQTREDKDNSLNEKQAHAAKEKQWAKTQRRDQKLGLNRGAKSVEVQSELISKKQKDKKKNGSNNNHNNQQKGQDNNNNKKNNKKMNDKKEQGNNDVTVTKMNFNIASLISGANKIVSQAQNKTTPSPNNTNPADQTPKSPRNERRRPQGGQNKQSSTTMGE